MGKDEKQPLDLAAIDEASPAQIVDKDGKPKEAISDGDAFIRRRLATANKPLKRVTVDGDDFFIREVGSGEVGEVLVGQWRVPESSSDEQKQFLGLETADRMVIVTIQKCVVKEDRTPLWSQGNVTLMHSGEEQEKFGALIGGLYLECIQVNPTLMPSNNPTALRRIYQFFG